MKTTGIFSTLRTSLNGLLSQMKKLEVISDNIANAESLPDENGKIYNRKFVVEKQGKNQSALGFGEQLSLSLRKTNSKHIGKDLSKDVASMAKSADTRQFEILESKGEKLVFDPNNPNADENGYIKMPNVNVIEEMVEMISASRSYEANVSVMNATKAMVKRTMEI